MKEGYHGCWENSKNEFQIDSDSTLKKSEGTASAAEKHTRVSQHYKISQDKLGKRKNPGARQNNLKKNHWISNVL